ncbi:hypothetical protein PVAP13_6NG230500 [Panicum virgatum]|uniref:Uncharacterized protein n=1 Tax=Panicum virgatum TaxID=38727 RepID=A0A8T0QZE9_PANVG|nr:hypothetical protein PVAP13_6NG230500 [Panicum virgatum]
MTTSASRLYELATSPTLASNPALAALMDPVTAVRLQHGAHHARSMEHGLEMAWSKEPWRKRETQRWRGA